MTTTARLGLDVPQATETISSYPAEAAQSLGVLDNAVIVTQGTLASRPSASTVPEGNEYYATDTTQLFKSTGSAWNQVPVINSSGSSGVLQLASAQQLAMTYGATGNVAAGTSITITHGIGRTPQSI